MTVDTVTRPTEVVFSKSGSRASCVDISCGARHFSFQSSMCLT
jgi:hypothetical protein